MTLAGAELRSWSQLRQTYIDSSRCVSNNAPPEAIRAESRSQAAWVLQRLLDAAISLCRSRGFHAGTEEANDLLSEAGEIASELRDAALFGSDLGFSGIKHSGVSKEEVYSALALTSKANPRNLIADIRKNGRMQINREAFERGVARYLNSELRDTQVDALLLIAVADMEITAYLDEMLSWKPLIGARSMFDLYSQGSLVWAWFKGRLRGFAWGAIAIAGALASTKYLGFPSDDATLFLALGVISIYLLTTVVTLPIALGKSRAFAEERARTMALIRGMVGLFSELHAPGPLSVAHLRSRFTSLEGDGAVWPNSLWPLLDDLETRGIQRLHCE